MYTKFIKHHKFFYKNVQIKYNNKKCPDFFFLKLKGKTLSLDKKIQMR